jgi:hypothetical protein
MLRFLRTEVFLCCLAACGVEIGASPNVGNPGKGDDGKSPDAGTPPDGSNALTPTAFLNKIGIRYCDESFRCKATYPDGATAFANDFGTTVSQCYTGVDAYYQPAVVEQSIAAGRVTFQPMQGTSCLAGIMYTPDCNQFWFVEPTYPASCDTTLVGKIPDGGACVSIFDCANLTSRCDQATKTCIRVQ